MNKPAIIDTPELVRIEERIRVRLRRTAEDIIEIGRDLIEAKRLVGHGRFLPWLETAFGMSNATASRFMNVTEKFGGKSVSLQDFTAEALYLLAAPSTPESVREEVLTKTAQGFTVSVEEARKMVEDARADERAKQPTLDINKIRTDAETAATTRTEAKIRSEYADKHVMTDDELAAHVEQVNASLVREAERANEARDKAVEDLKAERAKRKGEAKFDHAKAVTATSMRIAITNLALAAKLEPAELVKIEQEHCKLTKEPIGARIGAAADAARRMLPWLQEFVAECDRAFEGKKS